MTQTPSPFDPVTIGPLTLRNRFIKSGAYEGMCRAGRPTRALLEHNRDLAIGGIGMTTIAYGAVAKVGRTLPDQIWLCPEAVADLRAITDAVHAEGAAISLQITHGGSFITGIHVRGATMSAMGGFNKAGLFVGNFLQRAMTEKDMEEVAAQFAQGARIAREAGFDAVELHMGHGYLLNQFISPLSNQRTDAYGGSAENRVRFPANVLARVKDAVGKEMAVLAKINVADGVRRGATVEDAIVTGRSLQAAGADMLVLSGGRNIESVWFTFGSKMNQEEFGKVLKSPVTKLTMKIAAMATPKDLVFKEMYFQEYSRRIRAALDMPLGYLGGVKSLANVQQAMADGFECVVMARALIHDTGIINKFRNGQATRSECDACNGCVPYIYHEDGVRCIYNPDNDPKLNRQPVTA